MFHYLILITISVVWAVVVGIGGHADIFVLVHVNIADIGLAVFVIGVVGAAVAAVAAAGLFLCVVHFLYPVAGVAAG